MHQIKNKFSGSKSHFKYNYFLNFIASHVLLKMQTRNYRCVSLLNRYLFNANFVSEGNR